MIVLTGVSSIAEKEYRTDAWCFLFSLFLGWIYMRVLIPNLRQLFKKLKRVSKNLEPCPWLQKALRTLFQNVSKMPWEPHSAPECHQVTIHQSVQTLLWIGTRCIYISNFSVYWEFYLVPSWETIISLDPGTIDITDWTSLFCRGYFVHCRVFESTPSFHPSAANISPPARANKEKCFQTLLNIL